MSNKKSVFSFHAFKKRLSKKLSKFSSRNRAEPVISTGVGKGACGSSVNPLPDPTADHRLFWSAKRGFVTRSHPNLTAECTSDTGFETSDPEDEREASTVSVDVFTHSLSAYVPTTYRSGSQSSLLSGYQSSVQSITEQDESDDDFVPPPQSCASENSDNEAAPSRVLDLTSPADNVDAIPLPHASKESRKVDEFVTYKKKLKKIKRSSSTTMMSGWSSLGGILTYKTGGGIPVSSQFDSVNIRSDVSKP
ncbi:hypothetical protein CAPTEDRAFT_200030 [Capitella teleta]|uniref:Uncharacterized protein n=1 Tax=Capitella teleta TaxID=283909 RepID=R7UGR1_CAPTE|nr:hypothetical protein CAPTEDRAFT_200030 [Capitella teleta]|eukprot:ELU05734.1 hypothetical protein CAPTEDRAFT_200030 [Capitella teleta]